MAQWKRLDAFLLYCRLNNIRTNSKKVNYCEYRGIQTPKQLNLSSEEQESVMVKVIDTLLSSGLPNMTLQIACGFAANIYYESRFNFTAVNSTSGAYGLCQWLGERLNNLKSFSGGSGYQTDDGQIKFLIHELQGDYYNRRVYQKLIPVNNNEQECAYLVCFHFEIPKVNETERANVCNDRRGMATSIMNKYKNLKGLG